jgi:hypothetical protein
MHTSGLVFTFADEPTLVRDAQCKLTAAGPFTLGDGRGLCRAATLETTDPKAAHDWHDWAAALPGVEGVEVVFIHWDDAAEVNHVEA